MTQHQEASQEIKRKRWKIGPFPVWTYEERHQQFRKRRIRAPKRRRITKQEWFIPLILAVCSAIAIELAKIFILPLH